MTLSPTGRARAAAALALRWHVGTGALVALAACLTLVGALPALTVIGTEATPLLSLGSAQGLDLLRDWGPKGIPFTRMEAIAIAQAQTLLQGAIVLVVLVGLATLLALHAARATARGNEITVARAVGASRRITLRALVLEAAALASLALLVAMLVTLVLSGVLRATWPGTVAEASRWPLVAVAFGISAMTLLSPLLLARAVSATRLVNTDRRPLTLAVPALQLGPALVVIGGGTSLARAAARDAARVTNLEAGMVTVQELESREQDRLRRAQGIAAFLEQRHAESPGSLVSVASLGMHRALGTSAYVMSECGACAVGPIAVRNKTAMATHHAVTGDTFAVAGLKLLAGRALTDRDRWGEELVVVVNQRAATDLFQDGDAVGRRIKLGMLGTMWFRVVGIVADAPPVGLTAGIQPPHTVFLSALQQPPGMLEIGTRGALDSGVPVDVLGVRRGAPATLAERWALDARAVRWLMRVLWGVGSVTALIALGGLVTMLLLWLASQRHELGVRRAVGARARDIGLLILSRAVLVSVAGIAIGAWLGLIAWDVLPRIVPGAPAWDGGAVLMAGTALSVMALLVSGVVAARFVRTPVTALLHTES